MDELANEILDMLREKDLTIEGARLVLERAVRLLYVDQLISLFETGIGSGGYGGYTEADKEEVVNAVLAALPAWTGGSY